MKMSLRTTVITALTLFILVLALTILLVNWELAEQRVEKRSKDYLTFMLDSLQGDIEYALKNGDRNREWLQRKFTLLGNDVSINVAYLIDDTGQIIASKQRSLLGSTMSAESLHACNQAEAEDWLKHLEKVKSSLSGEVVLTADRAEAIGLYPVTFGQLNALRSTRVGVIFAKYTLEISKAQAKRAVTYQVMEFSTFLGLLTIVLGMFLHLRVTTRIQQLVKMTRRIAAGDLTTLSGVQGNDEVGELAHSLENMATKRFQVENELLEAHNQLEQRVHERTIELSQANAQLHGEIIERQRTEAELMIQKEELKVTLEHLQTTQTELIQAEKMAMLGQLVAGVAHEINTPLGAIRSSVGSINNSLSQLLPQLAEFFHLLSSAEQERIFLALLHRSLASPTQLSAKEERQIKRALIRQLEQYPLDNADVIADTLVDMGIYDHFEPFLPLLQGADSERILQTAYKLSDLQSSAKTIETAINRVSKIVFALKTYARFDHSGEKIQVDITEGIETVLTLYHHQIKQGVDVVKNYATLVPVWCYPDELNQVWTNLIHNALQAMEYKGTLTIDIGVRDNQVLVSITDTGKGIPAEILPKIFQPFFTTKPAGEGSGLGLDIVRKILDKHQGQILVASSIPGKTTFTVFLPIHSTSSQETTLDA
jgi:C4-dicarboxylate-specific signal transduction histidine kinase